MHYLSVGVVTWLLFQTPLLQARVLAANRKPLYCTLRTRKRCAVLDGDGQLKRVHHILNECVVDR